MFSQLSLAYFIFMPILASVLLLLNYILSIKPKNPDIQKGDIYESGFDSMKDITKRQFSIRYFQTIIAFLVFDVDITLFIPYVSLSTTSFDIMTYFELTIAIISCLIFIVGLNYDLKNGLLDYADPNQNKLKK